MGAQIDVAVLADAASRFDAIAASLDRIAASRVTFGAARAGRAHAASGEAVRGALELLGDDVRSWSRAVAEIASQVRISADRYVGAEARAAARLR